MESPGKEKKKVTRMIRKVNAGGGAQLLLIKRAPRLTCRGRHGGGPGHAVTQATERIWIKTQSCAGRGLLFYEALMGVERSVDYLRVKAPGRRGGGVSNIWPLSSRLESDAGRSELAAVRSRDFFFFFHHVFHSDGCR